MSIRSWNKEFLPVSAKKAANDFNDPSDLVIHSLRRWTGFTHESMSRHNTNLYQVDNGSTDCALCEAYRDESCRSCPIFKTTSRYCNNQYMIFKTTNNPNPMIKLLTRVLKKLK